MINSVTRQAMGSSLDLVQWLLLYLVLALCSSAAKCFPDCTNCGGTNTSASTYYLIHQESHLCGVLKDLGVTMPYSCFILAVTFMTSSIQGVVGKV